MDGDILLDWIRRDRAFSCMQWYRSAVAVGFVFTIVL